MKSPARAQFSPYSERDSTAATDNANGAGNSMAGLLLSGRQRFIQRPRSSRSGRVVGTWWAHFEFARLNTTPIGDLAMRATRAVSNVQHRRAEQKAREEVQRVLKDFEAQR
jgi:hypothetical protein